MRDGRVKSRLMVTGATGLLGVAVVREALARYDVWGVSREPAAAWLPCRTAAVDLRDAAAVARVVDAIGPDVVVHAAALTSADHCERDPSTAWDVNVGGTRNLLRALDGRACRFVFISTDAVFDGTRGGWTEDDRAAPVNVYGRTKLEAEEAVLVARPDALVVRTVFYGWNVLPKQSLAEWVLDELRAGRSVSGFVDVRFSPLVTVHLARLLCDFTLTSAGGRLHLGSRDGCSKYDFARRVAETFGEPLARVVPATLGSAGLVAARPRDVTLDCARAAGILGRPMPAVAEGLAEFAARPGQRSRPLSEMTKAAVRAL